MYAIIKQEQEMSISISSACCCLSVSKSGYYEWDKQMQLPAQEDPYEMELRNEIQKIAIEFPRYGYRRITPELRRRGYKVNGYVANKGGHFLIKNIVK